MSSELSIRSAKKLKGEREREKGLWQKLPDGEWYRAVSGIQVSGTSLRPTGEHSEAHVNFYIHAVLAPVTEETYPRGELTSEMGISPVKS